MKIFFKFLAILTVLTVAVAFNQLHAQDQDAPPPPQDDQGQGDQGGDQGASFQTFYDQLGDQGTWVQTDNYGYVFQPNVTDPNWAPYTDGHWVYTDQGWAWVSDEPWGWATYHYGRWANIDGYGWIWVPGYRWAPAWVSWRYGGGYCGWAPLPPETFVGAEYGGAGVSIGIGFHFGSDVDTNFNIGPGCYNFVRVGDMGYGNYRGHYIDRSRNYTVINNTTNITNININQGGRFAAGGGNFRGVAVGGPSLAEVNARARTHVQTVQLTAANQPGRSTLHGNSLAVYAPAVNPASIHQARPARVGQTIANPAFNRGDSISKPLAVTSSVRPPAPSAEAIQAARTAELHAPAKARIATANTPVRTHITQPLTSMEPVHRTTAAATPGTYNANTVKPEVSHPAANSPYTGESVKPSEAYHPQAQSSPYTGESVKPAQTYHPQAETSPYTGESVKPTEAYHPQSQAVHEEAPAQVYHPQSQAVHEEAPTQVYHPQSQAVHEEAPAQVYHPQSQAEHEEAPAQAFHPQSQAVHEEAPAVHESAPASHPAGPPAAAAKPAGKPAGNPNKQGQ